MATTPIIQSNGSASGIGIAGEGRKDMVIGETMDITDTEVSNAGVPHLTRFLNVPPGSALTVLAGDATETPSFVPDVDGSYFIEMLVDGVHRSKIIIAVPLTNTLARMPAFEEARADYNEAGNVLGWHPDLIAFMRQADIAFGGGDINAIHRNVAAEISTIVEKITPVPADLLVIEDSEDGNNKKRVQMANVSANDANAVHVNVGGEIVAIAEKALPAAADVVIIEDAADADNKKRVEISNLPGPAAPLATATGDTTTTSAVDVLVNAMTLTPAAGTYMVWFTGSVDHSSTDDAMEMSVYAGGVQDATSERRVQRGAGQGNVTVPFTCMAKVAVNGAEAIEGQWRTTAATATMHERTLAIMKVAP